MFLGLGILLVLATALTYARINRRRDALQRHLRVRHAHGPECVGDVKGDWHPRNKKGKGKDREA